jgi:hypothetical protein
VGAVATRFFGSAPNQPLPASARPAEGEAHQASPLGIELSRYDDRWWLFDPCFFEDDVFAGDRVEFLQLEFF